MLLPPSVLQCVLVLWNPSTTLCLDSFHTHILTTSEEYRFFNVVPFWGPGFKFDFSLPIPLNILDDQNRDLLSIGMLFIIFSYFVWCSSWGFYLLHCPGTFYPWSRPSAQSFRNPGSNSRPAERVLDTSNLTSWRARDPIKAKMKQGSGDGELLFVSCLKMTTQYESIVSQSKSFLFLALRILFINFSWKFLFSCSPSSLGYLSPLLRCLALHWSHMLHNSAASSHIADKQSAFGCDHIYPVMI